MMAHEYPLLSVSPAKEDHANLRKLLTGSPWLIRESHSLRSALMVLEEHRIPVLICERDLRPGTWRDLLELAAQSPNPPSVIVACRQADEELWAQTLSAGAYDLLAKPFDPAELQRTLREARQHWQDLFETEHASKVMAVGA